VNDGSCEGIEYKELNALTVQFTPEACSIGNPVNPLYKKFFAMMENGEFFETTMYAGNGYATKKEDAESILKGKKIVLTVMDICGAMSVKTNYSNVATVYIKRPKSELLRSILTTGGDIENMVKRIISIDDERRNEEICDYAVDDPDPTSAAEKILKMLNIEN
jgi:guanylate kinase